MVVVPEDPHSHWIVLLDIEDFSLRTETAQTTLHDDLYHVVEFALRRAGLDMADCEVQDRGDGLLLLAPADTRPTLLLRELVRGLDDALAHHRATYNHEHRMRLRLGLEQGLVNRRGQRWTGVTVNDLARLVDAAPVKRSLAMAGRAHLVVVVSEDVHRKVVLGGYPGLDPAAYLPADFVTKHGERRRGWVTVPGYPAPPGLPADSGEPPRAGAPGGASGTGGTAGGAGGGTEPGSPVPSPALHTGDLHHSQVAWGQGATAVGRDYVGGDQIAGDYVAGNKIEHHHGGRDAAPADGS